jgi:glutaredoxin 3
MSVVKVRMYTTPWCGFCAAARKLLSTKGIEFEDIDVSMDPELRRQMTELSGGTTVPQILIDGEPIGGYDEIAALDSTGALDKMLNPGS